MIKIMDFERWVKIDRDCIISNKVNTTMRNYIFNRDGWKCVYCGSEQQPFEADHVLPISRGGLTTEENLVCACLPCNRSKKDKTPEEWGFVCDSI